MHIEKYTLKAGFQIVLHCERDRPSTARYGNKSIAPNRSDLNLDFEGILDHEGKEADFLPYYDSVAYWREKTEKLTGRKAQKSGNVLVSAIVTLPEEYHPRDGIDWHDWYEDDRNREREEAFFKEVAAFFVNRFAVFDITKKGKRCSNFIYCCVHRDESAPHLHIGFVPVLRETKAHKHKDKDSNGNIVEREILSRSGTISACEVVNRNVLKSLHPDLDKHLRASLEWYHGGVLLSEEERMRKGQNIATEVLKALPETYRQERSEANRLDSLIKAVGDIRESKEKLDECYKELERLSNPENMPPLVKLVDALQRDGKLTKADMDLNPTYKEALFVWLGYKKALKGIKTKLAAIERGARVLI